MKNNRSHILSSQDSKSFTSLNRFDERKKIFEGEYSLLFNRYSYDSLFLSKFLMKHINKPLLLIDSDNEKYNEIVNSYTHFLKEDVDKYIEEKVQLEEEQKNDLIMDRNLGQFQLAIIKQMIEKQLEVTQAQSANSNSDHKVLLGKELAFQWVLHTIDDVLEKGKF
jgi:hypothetical protein